MKKVYESLLWVVVISIALDLLCACLDWVVASIVISIVLLVSAIALCVIYMVFVKHKCPKCGTVFKGNKVEIFFAPHGATKRFMKCPMCNEKMWCEDFFESKKDKTKQG